MKAIGWILIIGGILLMRAVLKGQVFDASGKFIAVEQIIGTFEAFAIGDTQRLDALAAAQGSGIGDPVAEPQSVPLSITTGGSGGVGAGPLDGGADDSKGPLPGVTRRYKLGPVKPHTQKGADILGSKFGIKTIGGVRQDSLPDHPSGHAIDIMINNIPNGMAVGQALATYARSQSAALRIQYIIWDRKIWNLSRNSEGWRTYGGAHPHRDHVHISFIGPGIG